MTKCTGETASLTSSAPSAVRPQSTLALRRPPSSPRRGMTWTLIAVLLTLPPPSYHSSSVLYQSDTVASASTTNSSPAFMYTKEPHHPKGNKTKRRSDQGHKFTTNMADYDDIEKYSVSPHRLHTDNVSTMLSAMPKPARKEIEIRHLAPRQSS